jgi:ferredoxin-NADP reductase
MVGESELMLRVCSREEGPGPLVRLDLARADGGELPPWTAGSHIGVAVEGVGWRHYSLCGSTGDRYRYRIGVQREAQGRGGSVAVHRWQPGTLVRTTPPRNNFPLQPHARHHLFIAGGIGLTPIVPMARWCEARGAPWELHYGVRDEDRRYFRELLDAPHRHGRVKVYLDARSERIDIAGVLNAAAPGTHVYCCGPQGLMDAVRGASAAYPRLAVHFEAFQATESAAMAGADQPFDVVCAGSGLRLAVGAGQSMLEALEAAGLALPYSCREGICGTCELEVLEGEPDHRDSVLSAAERAAGRKLMPCVSRARSPQLVVRC